jgi:hypothetical protein
VVEVIVEQNFQIPERFSDNPNKPIADGQICMYIRAQKSTQE